MIQKLKTKGQKKKKAELTVTMRCEPERITNSLGQLSSISSYATWLYDRSSWSGISVKV